MVVLKDKVSVLGPGLGLEPRVLVKITGSLDFVRDNTGEPLPEGTFRRLLDFLVQNEDDTGRHTKNSPNRGLTSSTDLDPDLG